MKKTVTVAGDPAVLHATLVALRVQHPCHLFRLFPWTFPRACEDDGQLRTEKKAIAVETMDLLHSCPTWSCTAPDAFPLQRAMREFRKRWSYRTVFVAAPETPDYGNVLVANAYWDCKSDLVWRVLGGTAFLNELSNAIDGSPEFLEAFPLSFKPERRPQSLFLCSHEIRGD
jgi:hypothetical protein